MATLTWGKPKIEIAPYVAGVYGTPTWAVVGDVKQDTAKLTTAKGTKYEALNEGGELVDARYQKNKYSFEFELFVQKDVAAPITDTDGIIDANYALRLTPEDVTQAGFQLYKTAVSVETTWTSKDGTMLKYTFESLKPATGNMIRTYTQAS